MIKLLQGRVAGKQVGIAIAVIVIIVAVILSMIVVFTNTPNNPLYLVTAKGQKTGTAEGYLKALDGHVLATVGKMAHRRRWDFSLAPDNSALCIATNKDFRMATPPGSVRNIVADDGVSSEGALSSNKASRLHVAAAPGGTCYFVNAHGRLLRVDGTNSAPVTIKINAPQFHWTAMRYSSLAHALLVVGNTSFAASQGRHAVVPTGVTRTPPIASPDVDKAMKCRPWFCPSGIDSAPRKCTVATSSDTCSIFWHPKRC